MPSTSSVPVELAVNVLKKYIAHFANDQLPPWKSEIWGTIANDPELNGKWTIGSIRTNVREDRRGILSEARKQCGIFVNNISNKNKELNPNEEENDISEVSDEDCVKQDSDSEDNDKQHFTVEISRDVWDEMFNLEPLVYKGRKYIGFKPKVWTNVVSNAFWNQHHLKCAFVFKRGRITETGKNYATINGHCIAKDCKNPVKGIIKNCPGDVGSVYIEMYCRDTRFVKHEDVKRPINGTERLKVQEELLKTRASTWRKNKAKDSIIPGNTGSPFLYNSNTLHQAKNEAYNKKLGIKLDDKRDMILAIRNMNIDPSYVNSILAIGDTPFYVFYATPTQFQAYSEYQRTHRQYSSICIDATGGVVKKLADSRGDKTSSIFLYEIVINFNGTSVSVYQMLSETHDTAFISFWLSRWAQKVKLPSQAVSDGSKALLNAMSITFNSKTLKEYVNYCFEGLITGTNKRPKTFIRLDTAHFIHSVTKWKCFESALGKIVKTFFIRCMALVIDCRELKQLEEIFILMLIVANTEFDDSIIAFDNNCMTPLDARRRLEKLISDRNIKVAESDLNKTELEEKNLLDNLSNFDTDHLGWSVAILTWVDNLCQKANTIIFNGTNLNGFRVRGLYDRLVEKIKEFPIFTNICTPETMSRATSCYVEGDFKDLKLNLEQQVKLPTTILKFLKLHISELLGSICIFRAKVKKFIVDNLFQDEMNECDHEILFENWRGLGKEKTNCNVWTDHKQMTEEEYNIAYNQKFVKSASTNDSSTYHDHDYLIKYDNNIKDDLKKDANVTNPSTSIETNNDCLNKALEKYNKNKQDTKKETKYFENYPEVTHQNNILNRKVKKVFLLTNGNLLGTVFFEKKNWIAYNTCPFDTLVQILFHAAIEYSNFYKFITECDIPLFEFLIHFMNNGPSKKIYEKRLALLHPLYSGTCRGDGNLQKCSEKVVLCETINCKDNITTLWQKLLQKAPGMLEKITCSNPTCGYSYTKDLPVLFVNHNVITRKGFSSLEEALDFHPEVFNITCPLCKSGKQTRHYIPKGYIFVELDIRGSSKELSGRTCTLSELPTKISLKSYNKDLTSTNLCYQLSGVAAYDVGHYYAYCRKISGSWKKFNDLKVQAEFVAPSTKLQPHGVFYVLEQEQQQITMIFNEKK